MTVADVRRPAGDRRRRHDLVGRGGQVSKPGDGQVEIASVENNYSERAGVVVFTVTEDEKMVEGNASTLQPGTEQSYGLLECRDDGLQATQLRIQVDLGMEGGYEVERFVDLDGGTALEAQTGHSS